MTDNLPRRLKGLFGTEAEDIFRRWNEAANVAYRVHAKAIEEPDRILTEALAEARRIRDEAVKKAERLRAEEVEEVID